MGKKSGSVYVRSNDEVYNFLARNAKVILKACADAHLPDADRDGIVYFLADKFACGDWHYDEERHVKESAYVYRAAKNAAKDALHRPAKLGVLNGDLDWACLAGRRIVHAHEMEDIRLMVKEALNRLLGQCDKRKVEMLVRYALLGEDRELLAEEFGERPDYLSTVKHNLLPKLQYHLRAVMREDEDGRLTFSSDNRTRYLRHHIEWL